MNVKARHDAPYFLALVDDQSCYGYAYILFHRSEALDCFKCIVKKVGNKKEER